jgi:UDP:flavonoid glycosyltransferase YjiC (YdhE family)
MLVVPGLVGDQVMNGRAVEHLGLGVCLKPGVVGCSEVVSALQRLIDDKSFAANLAVFRSKDNYTDSTESLCQKLERLSSDPGCSL